MMGMKLALKTAQMIQYLLPRFARPCGVICPTTNWPSYCPVTGMADIGTRRRMGAISDAYKKGRPRKPIA
jgi:hypothetical protein